MADDQDKTEEPSEKKIQDARKEGNVAKSQDVAALATLCVGFLTIIGLIGWWSERLFALWRFLLGHIGQDITPVLVFRLGFNILKELCICVLPLAVFVAVAGVLGNVMQFGFNFTTKPIFPKFSKLNPLKGLKNLLSVKKLIDAVKIILKVTVVFGLMYVLYLSFLKEVNRLELLPIMAQLAWLREKMIIIFAAVIVAFLVFAILDFFIVRMQYFKSLRMSKQEVKDEYKQMEGDPRIKAKIRQLQMQAAKNRMMADVPRADVVITNPTHYAVALLYEAEKNRAPVVVAKGVDNVAFKIREVAQAAGVPIYEQKELARALYRECEIGDEIPVALYQATAVVLSKIRAAAERSGNRK